MAGDFLRSRPWTGDQCGLREYILRASASGGTGAKHWAEQKLSSHAVSTGVPAMPRIALELRWPFRGAQVGVWGVAFKPQCGPAVGWGPPWEGSWPQTLAEGSSCSHLTDESQWQQPGEEVLQP